MNAGFEKTAVYTNLRGLDRLHLAAERREDGSLEKVAHRFESIFTDMMLKSMRDASTIKGGLFDSSQMKFYQGMFDHQLSVSLASGHGLGIARMLTRQLGGEPGARATGAAKPAAQASDAPDTEPVR